MENLLKWSVEAAKPGNENLPPPDPKALSQLFGAPDDLTLMREELRNVVDSTDKDARVESLENFREHVENIDNANNMGALWEPLIYLTQDVDTEISGLALSCIGSAVQNNDKAQQDLVKLNAIGKITSLCEHNNDGVVKKALFALASAIAHCPEAYDQFVEAKGWQVLHKFLQGIGNMNEQSQGRVLSLIYAITLLMGERSIYAELKSTNLLDILHQLETISSERTKERVHDILRTIDENPQTGVKLLGA